MLKDVGHLKQKPRPGVFKCSSDWFILQGKKFHSEKVGMVFTFNQRIIGCELTANFLISSSGHIFPAFSAKNVLWTKRICLM